MNNRTAASAPARHALPYCSSEGNAPGVCREHFAGFKNVCPPWCTDHINAGPEDDLHRKVFETGLGDDVQVEIEQAKDYDDASRWQAPVFFLSVREDRFDSDQVRALATTMSAAADLFKQLERCRACGVAVEPVRACPSWCTDHEVPGAPADEVHRRLFVDPLVDTTVAITQHVLDPEPPQLSFEVSEDGHRDGHAAVRVGSLLITAGADLEEIRAGRPLT